MDPNEIIKAAPEIAKGVAALGAAIPFTGIVKRMLGPAADELAEMWRDEVRLYRYGRQLKCVEKAERMAREAGFIPQAVPPKILFPLLEGASFEEDENLHDMWAALLANAGSPDSAQIRPGFIATLKQMAADEAALLNWMFERSTDPDIVKESFDFHEDLVDAYESLGFVPTPSDIAVADGDSALTCLQSLQSQNLITSVTGRAANINSVNIGKYEVTNLGFAFMFACCPPRPKE